MGIFVVDEDPAITAHDEWLVVHLLILAEIARVYVFFIFETRQQLFVELTGLSCCERQGRQPGWTSLTWFPARCYISLFDIFFSSTSKIPKHPS